MADSRTIGVILAGATIGAAAGFLFFTDLGRGLRGRIEPALDDMASEIRHLRGTMTKAANVASEGWKLLNDVLGESEPQSARYPGPNQTSPF